MNMLGRILRRIKRLTAKGSQKMDNHARQTEIIDDLTACDSLRKELGRIVEASRDGDHGREQAMYMLQGFSIEEFDETFIRMRDNVRKMCGFDS